jgi:hypothetical protein
VKVGQNEAHQQWMLENEAALAKAHPEGTRYIGTFTTVFTTDKQSGFYRSFVELDSCAALDRLAAAAKDPSPSSGGRTASGPGSAIVTSKPHGASIFSKAVVDATVWDPPVG